MENAQSLAASLTGLIGTPFAVPCRPDVGGGWSQVFVTPLRWGLTRLLALPTLQQLYVQAQRRPEVQFSDRALGVLGISYAVHGHRHAIPRSGPAIVVANHPFGALDGLVLSSLLARVRPDARVLANEVLGAVPELRDQLVLVDIFDIKRAAGRNGPAMREAMRWVQRGGCLCVFPAGAVSHVQWRSLQFTDPAWHASIGRMVRLTGAPVVPCFIAGANGVSFQLAGVLHPWLRTLLLPRALLRSRGKHVDVHLGSAIPASHVAGDDRSVATTLRRAAYACKSSRAGVIHEVAWLMRDQSLARAERFAVFWAKASQAPGLLREIGRERELAFRAVREGSGRDIDLDAFDQRYTHLCVWDEKQQQLAGAYRLRTVDDSSDHQVGTLYTRTLFRFDRRLIHELAPAIELGRAFVRASYQKQYAPLMLLWKGIARFVAQHHKHRHLFGALSISSAYDEAARTAIVRYLRQHAYDATLARFISPCHPLRTPNGDDEHGEKGRDAAPPMMPVLLRQYLKLNARVLGFSLDPDFGNTLDALMLVDLPRAPRAVLKRFMGETQAQAYLADRQPS